MTLVGEALRAEREKNQPSSNNRELGQLSDLVQLKLKINEAKFNHSSDNHYSNLEKNLLQLNINSELRVELFKNLAELASLKYRWGLLGQLNAKEQMTEGHLQSSSEELRRVKEHFQSKFESFNQDSKFNNLLDQAILEKLLQTAQVQGVNDYGHFQRQLKLEQQKLEVERLSKQGIFDRFFGILQHSRKLASEVIETVDNLFIGSWKQLVVAFHALEAGEKLSTVHQLMKEEGANHILKNINTYNSLWGSVYGTKKDFTKLSDWQSYSDSFFAFRALGALTNTLQESLRFFGDELILAEMNLLGANINYRQFKKLQQEDSLLKWSERFISLAELSLGTVAILSTGDTNAAAHSFKSVTRALGMPFVMGAGSALGTELLEEEFNVERFLDRTLEQTVGSIFFVVCLSAPAQSIVRFRYGKINPNTLPQFGPNKIDQLNTLLKKLEISREAIDGLDALGDLSQAVVAGIEELQFGNYSLKDLNEWKKVKRILGRAIHVKVAALDAFDMKVIFKRGNINSANNVEQTVLPKISREDLYVDYQLFINQHPELLPALSSNPRIFKAQEILNEWGIQGDNFSPNLIEIEGKKINGQNIKYRFWNMQDWQILCSKVALNANAFSDFERGIIDLPLDLKTSRERFLRILFEEQSHLALGKEKEQTLTRGGGDVEFYVKLLREGKMPEAGYRALRAEKILEEVIDAYLLEDVSNHTHFDYQQIINSVCSALSLVEEIDLEKLDLDHENNLLISAINLGIEEGNKRRAEYTWENVPFIEQESTEIDDNITPTLPLPLSSKSILSANSKAASLNSFAELQSDDCILAAFRKGENKGRASLEAHFDIKGENGSAIYFLKYFVDSLVQKGKININISTWVKPLLEKTLHKSDFDKIRKKESSSPELADRIILALKLIAYSQKISCEYEKIKYEGESFYYFDEALGNWQALQLKSKDDILADDSIRAILRSDWEELLGVEIVKLPKVEEQEIADLFANDGALKIILYSPSEGFVLDQNLIKAKFNFECDGFIEAFVENLVGQNYIDPGFKETVLKRIKLLGLVRHDGNNCKNSVYSGSKIIAALKLSAYFITLSKSCKYSEIICRDDRFYLVSSEAVSVQEKELFVRKTEDVLEDPTIKVSKVLDWEKITGKKFTIKTTDSAELSLPAEGEIVIQDDQVAGIVEILIKSIISPEEVPLLEELDKYFNTPDKDGKIINYSASDFLKIARKLSDKKDRYWKAIRNIFGFGDDEHVALLFLWLAIESQDPNLYQWPRKKIKDVIFELIILTQSRIIEQKDSLESSFELVKKYFIAHALQVYSFSEMLKDFRSGQALLTASGQNAKLVSSDAALKINERDLISLLFFTGVDYKLEFMKHLQLSKYAILRANEIKPDFPNYEQMDEILNANGIFSFHEFIEKSYDPSLSLEENLERIHEIAIIASDGWSEFVFDTGAVESYLYFSGLCLPQGFEWNKRIGEENELDYIMKQHQKGVSSRKIAEELNALTVEQTDPPNIRTEAQIFSKIFELRRKKLLAQIAEEFEISANISWLADQLGIEKEALFLSLIDAKSREEFIRGLGIKDPLRRHAQWSDADVITESNDSLADIDIIVLRRQAQHLGEDVSLPPKELDQFRDWVAEKILELFKLHPEVAQKLKADSLVSPLIKKFLNDFNFAEVNIEENPELEQLFSQMLGGDFDILAFKESMKLPKVVKRKDNKNPGKDELIKHDEVSDSRYLEEMMRLKYLPYILFDIAWTYASAQYEIYFPKEGEIRN